jgi:hypothetical protein
MRVIPTGNSKKIAIIAATAGELLKLKRLEVTREFNDAITLEPQKSEQYQCFMMVYTFDTGSRAKLFRLAYAIARKNGKIRSINRIKTVKTHRPPSYYAHRKQQAKKRRADRQRKRSRTHYFKLIPLLKAGKIAEVEAKARQIARELAIIDLL